MVASALLFSLGIRRPMEFVLEHIRSLDPKGDAIFYLDDGYIIADAAHAAKSLNHERLEGYALSSAVLSE